MQGSNLIIIGEDDPALPGSVKRIGMLGRAGIQVAIAIATFDAMARRIRRLPIRV